MPEPCFKLRAGDVLPGWSRCFFSGCHQYDPAPCFQIKDLSRCPVSCSQLLSRSLFCKLGLSRGLVTGLEPVPWLVVGRFYLHRCILSRLVPGRCFQECARFKWSRCTLQICAGGSVPAVSTCVRPDLGRLLFTHVGQTLHIVSKLDTNRIMFPIDDQASFSAAFGPFGLDPLRLSRHAAGYCDSLRIPHTSVQPTFRSAARRPALHLLARDNHVPRAHR